MDNTSLAIDIPSPNSQSYDLGARWQNVREYSVPLAVFGAVLTSVLPVVTTVGSILLLIVVVMKFPQLRHVPSNLLLASLAACDLLIGILLQPVQAASCVCTLTKENCSFILPTWLTYISYILGYSSILNVTLITIDRYMCIVESLRYLTIVTKTRALKAIIFAWVISAVLPVICLSPPFSYTVIRSFNIILISSVLLAIIFCYGKIFRISQDHRRHISQLQAVTQGPIKQEIQSAKTVFIVVGTAIFSYAPLIAIQLLLHFLPDNDHVKIFHPFALTLFLLNSSVNPLIIYFRSRKLRKFLKKLFKRDA